MSIEAFLGGGGSVCPFAARSRRHYATVGEPLRFYRPIIRAAAQLFAHTKGKNPPGALLVVGKQDPDGFEATKVWAREVFMEMMACFGLIAGASEAALEQSLADARAILLDDADPRRPVLGCDGAPLYTICMAPVYPTTHPRYAPRAAIVATWQADVALAAAEPAFSRIREAMKREHGHVYDADELMLPLPRGGCVSCGAPRAPLKGATHCADCINKALDAR